MLSDTVESGKWAPLDLLVLINPRPQRTKRKERKKTNGIEESTNALGFLQRGLEHGKMETTSDMNSSRR